MRESNEFETVVNLSTHLARETLEGLREVALKRRKYQNAQKEHGKI